MKRYHFIYWIYLTLLLCTFNTESIRAQNNTPLGADFAGMSNATVMMPGVWGVYHNQAGIAHVRQVVFATHFENSYFFSQFGVQAAALLFPLSTGTLAADYSHYGYPLYQENRIGLAYARPLGQRFSAGIQLNYFLKSLDMPRGTIGIAVGEIGIQAEPIDNLLLGAHIFNPWRAQQAQYADERMPTALRVGAGYWFSERFFISTETEKELDQEAVFKAGMQYQLFETVYLRGGISTQPVLNSFGLGFNYFSMSGDLAFRYNPQLGNTLHLSYIYRFGESHE